MIMPDIDLNFIAKQIERAFGRTDLLQGSIDIVRRDVARMADDISIIKTELQGMHAEVKSMRSEVVNIRHEIRSSFDILDARLRPLEDARP